MILEIEALLSPIPGDFATGPNLRHREADGNAYYRIKDARSAARIAERQAESEAERGGLAPEWRQIFTQTQELIASQSKDLEVACWLAEAALRLHGFAGLRDAFAVLDGLVRRYWPDLHSVDDEDVGAKVAPVAGLNGVGSDGALIQPLRLAPITAPGGQNPVGLWHYMVLRRRGAASPEAVQLAEATKSTTRDAFIAIYHDIAAALASYRSLAAQLDALCGDEAPPTSTIRNTLIEAQDALREVAQLDPSALGDPQAEQLPTAAAPPAEVAAPAQQSAPATVAQSAQLLTRDDALRELARIAAFFREHEPNSPTAYTLQTLIRRARLPLADLLAELIPDQAVRRSYLDAAGIGPEVSEN